MTVIIFAFVLCKQLDTLVSIRRIDPALGCLSLTLITHTKPLPKYQIGARVQCGLEEKAHHRSAARSCIYLANTTPVDPVPQSCRLH